VRGLSAFVVGIVVDSEVTTSVEAWLGNWRKRGVPDRRVVNHGEICGGCRAVIFRFVASMSCGSVGGGPTTHICHTN
jgi:hypothetical protein